MGLVVVGLGLFDISLWYIILDRFVDASGTDKLVMMTTTMLHIRNGCIDAGALRTCRRRYLHQGCRCGCRPGRKVEAGIPEDDPRNPATIADNVGDNVGDVAGMGADLYESYCGSILATAALGAAAFAVTGDLEMQTKAVLAPMLIAAVGILLSIFGIYMVHTREGATMKQLLRSLGTCVNTSAALIAVFTFVILYLLQLQNWVGISFSVITGLVAGIIIARLPNTTPRTHTDPHGASPKVQKQAPQPS